jgi:hypothetical protein
MGYPWAAFAHRRSVDRSFAIDQLHLWSHEKKSPTTAQHCSVTSLGPLMDPTFGELPLVYQGNMWLSPAAAQFVNLSSPFRDVSDSPSDATIVLTPTTAIARAKLRGWVVSLDDKDTHDTGLYKFCMMSFTTIAGCYMDLWSNMKLFVTANDDLMFLDSYSVAMECSGGACEPRTAASSMGGKLNGINFQHLERRFTPLSYDIWLQFVSFTYQTFLFPASLHHGLPLRSPIFPTQKETHPGKLFHRTQALLFEVLVGTLLFVYYCDAKLTNRLPVYSFVPFRVVTLHLFVGAYQQGRQDRFPFPAFPCYSCIGVTVYSSHPLFASLRLPSFSPLLPCFRFLALLFICRGSHQRCEP